MVMKRVWACCVTGPNKEPRCNIVARYSLVTGYGLVSKLSTRRTKSTWQALLETVGLVCVTRFDVASVIEGDP